MNIKRWTTGALAACLLTAPAAFADNHHDKDDKKAGYEERNYAYSSHARYEWTTEPGQVMLFKNPVSFEGEVTGVNSSHRMIKADNGMTIEVPNMALVWNGDTSMFAQNAELGDRVVLHLRQEEPYRVMKRNANELVIGSYDGVFYMTQDFVADIDLENLDGDIYRDTADLDLDDDPVYDNDLRSSDND